MLINFLPLIVCLVGLILFLALPTQPNPRPIESKIAKVGEWMFVVGLLVFLLVDLPHVAALIR
jgi:hypothetical protein